MGFLERLMFWREPDAEYEITDCFGEPNEAILQRLETSEDSTLKEPLEACETQLPGEDVGGSINPQD